ncbi:MAG: NAD(P)-dependent oxidoreductase [Desulfomonilia bacterium]
MKNLGWIGTGVMGSSMCMNLLRAGYQMSIYTRTESKAHSLIDAGALWCSSPAEVAKASEVVFSIVGYPQDVEDVFLSPSGLIPNAAEGTILVDMTTSRPSLAQTIYAHARNHNLHALDAPVSGGDVGARDATLAIMVGGDKDIFDTVLPLFEVLGKTIFYMGGAGTGQHTKMSNQILIASTMIGVVESLLYGYTAGLDQCALIDIIGTGAASSWSLNNLGRRIVSNDFSPGFFIKHFIKDMGIALDEARRMNLSLPGLALACQFYQAASALGLENLGTQALYTVFETLNNVPGQQSSARPVLP